MAKTLESIVHGPPLHSKEAAAIEKANGRVSVTVSAPVTDPDTDPVHGFG
jgi:hypothetical protein